MGPPVSSTPALTVQGFPRTWIALPPPGGRTIPSICGFFSSCIDIFLSFFFLSFYNRLTRARERRTIRRATPVQKILGAHGHSRFPLRRGRAVTWLSHNARLTIFHHDKACSCGCRFFPLP